MATILELIAQVRKLKSEHQLSLRTELALLTIETENDAVRTELHTHELLIKGVTKAQTIATAPVLAPGLREEQGAWYASIKL